MKKSFICYKFFLVIVLCYVAQIATAQEKPSDSLNIRKDFSLPNPVKYEAYYDVSSGLYYLYPKVGSVVVGSPVTMTVSEYQDYIATQQLSQYYKEKSDDNNVVFRKDQTDAKKKGLLPAITIKNKIFESIFGSNKIELIPQGYASFDLGALYQKIDNPLILSQNRTSFAINIKQRMQLSLLGKVGENLQLKANYDTQSGFAFENKLNLVWQAKGTWKDLQQNGIDNQKETGEDKIIKKVEFGNISMPSSNSLIQGSQSLFGAKTEFQLGKTKGTFAFSQQQGETSNVTVENGGTVKTFKINAIDYEDNQHFFIGHYFLDNYDSALQYYPTLNTKLSLVKLEVYVLDPTSSSTSEQKSILAIRDLGEGTSGYPSNSQNNLYGSINALGSALRNSTTAYNTINGQSFPNASGSNETYTDGEQFVFSRKARKLSTSEYTYNSNLGYVSLNQKLTDNKLLAVSYSFSVNGSSTVYKVGEFSDENTVIITKLLKPNKALKTTSPMWDLMMKNIYSMDASDISSENFVLNVYYKSTDGGKVNYLPNTSVKDKILLKLFNWDRLDQNNDVQVDGDVYGDGLFDFVSGITIDADNGKLIFTKAKPFGSYLQDVLGSDNSQYVFNELYTKKKTVAALNNLAQRYTIEGRYKGSDNSSAISLGSINIAQGSVTVTSNGQTLVEGQDYVVDYLAGTVTIINQQIKNSGQAINISLENQSTFNTQRKRYIGLNLERQFSDHFLLGATMVNYSETPLTQKVNYGSESVNNTVFGLNMMYNNEAPFLTRLVNKIPLIHTDAPSNISFKAEGAYLVPGTNSGMDDQSYLDDFEESTSEISLKDPSYWVLASPPELNTNDPVFSNAENSDDLKSGYGRGLLSWYNIDSQFYGVGGSAPSGVTSESLSNHASRRVKNSELSDEDIVAGDETYISTFDITYYPTERGPYNYNTANETTSDRWAGIMRPITVSDFVNSNVQYVEFWMMDPYADGNTLGANPKLKLQLGNVNEDILKDGYLQYENGLSTTSETVTTTTSNWGVQPSVDPTLYTFSSTGDDRTAQDVGLDGLGNTEELTKFGTSFVNPVTGNTDPSSDDFIYYMSDLFTGTEASSVIERYKYFRNPDGNSQYDSSEVSSQTPDTEDANSDLNLNQSEEYNQYTIDLSQGSFVVNSNFIVDTRDVTTTFKNGQKGTNRWYLFRIPVKEYDTDQGSASDDVLENVSFARLILQGFDNTSTLRFGSFNLVRSDWTKYTKNISATNDDTPDTSIADDEGTTTVDNSDFYVGSINIEENGQGTPPYMLPPGIEREVTSTSTTSTRENEASLYLKVLNLAKDARGVVKSTTVDMRRYKNLKLFVHAEDLNNISSNAMDSETKFFIRFGSDATDNYYEFEESLTYTPASATTQSEIWPDDNEIDLEIENFVNAKQKRDKENSDLLNYRYYYPDYGDENKKIYIKGRPSLGDVSVIMIGVRNTSGISKNLILWVDEMRLSGIDNDNGYAANYSLAFNLADFAQVDTNGSYQSVGWGSVDSKPSERSQSDTSTFNISSTVNLDKFIPEKVGMKIPLSYSYSQTIEDPKYNPLDTDVELKKSSNYNELKKVVRTYTQERSIGVTNMRKERKSNKKTKFYDVENLSLTAYYNDEYYRDVYTSREYRQYLKAYLDYNYSFKPFFIRPFNKLVSDTAKSYKYLRWLKEVNFNIVPTNFSFRTSIDRNYTELQYRDVDALLNGDSNASLDLIKSRIFYFSWQYSIGFNFTKSLKLNITSNTKTLNDKISANEMTTKSIFEKPFRVGRPILYNHTAQLSYKLPFEYLPYLDFVNAELGYGFTYNWNARSTSSTSVDNLGSIGQNSNTIVASSSVNFSKFFEKFSYFKKINKILQGRKKEIDSLNQVYEQAIQKKKKIGFKAYKFKNRITPFQSIIYALTSLKQLDINYTENNGTVLPGILSSPNFYGYGKSTGGPTFGFLVGSQSDIRMLAIKNGWITDSDLLTDSYIQTSVKNLDASLQIQPMNDFRIELSTTSRYNRNMTQSGFNVDADSDSSNGFTFAFENDVLSYSKSIWSFKSAFKSGDKLYEEIVKNTLLVSQKLGKIATDTGYMEHYSINNSYVLIPAFRAAMEGKSVGTMEDPKKLGLPLPNWRITYSGLRNIPLINSFFSKLDVSHSYSSTYTGTGIQSNSDYYNTPDGYDSNDDTINPYTFSSIGYAETFSPLFGVDATLRNNMQFNVSFNKQRSMILGLTSNTLTEDYSNEYVIGFGYIVKDFKLRLNIKGKTKNIKSDLNIKANLSIKDTKTTVRYISTSSSQITGGSTILGINFSADYNMSENFNIKLFYDQLMTKYKISTSYPISTLSAGISATFTFGGTSTR